MLFFNAQLQEIVYLTAKVQVSSMRIQIFLVLILFAIPSLHSRSVESIQRDLEDYRLQGTAGFKIIPILKVKSQTLEDFASDMKKSHGVTILLADSVKQRRTTSMSLRNREVRKAIEAVVLSTGSRWIYEQGNVIVFGALSELKPDYRQIWEEKHALEQELRAAKREERVRQQRSGRVAMGKLIIHKFEVKDAGLMKIIEVLSKATAESNRRGENIVLLVNPKDYPQRLSCTFEDTSLRVILDRVCKDFDLNWKKGRDAITIEKK